MISARDQAPLAIDVALASAPTYIGEAPTLAETTNIVVDVIRATTTLCLFFERGVREVLLAPDIATARAMRATLGGEYLLAGEVGGAAPPGFDLGNSPTEIARAELAGRGVLFATSNGTRALRACAGARAVFAGALRNAQAVATAALATGAASIVVVCSGRGELPAYDDTLCAGYIVRRLLDGAEAKGCPVVLHEGARIALAVLDGAQTCGGIHAALAQSDAYRAIEGIGLAGDLDWCVAADVASVVPRVTGTYAEGNLLVVTA
jgi:2-phosphosulfolactate phosphatase